MYRSLANANLISAGETQIAQRYVARFRQNNSADYFDTQDLSTILLDKPVGERLIKQVALEFDKAIIQAKGDLTKVNISEVLKDNRGIFLPGLELSDGVILKAFIGGTQQIEVVSTNTIIEQGSGIYRAELIVRIFDDFGVSEDDYSKQLLRSYDVTASWLPAALRNLINTPKQNTVDALMRGPLFAFWGLQHQRNVKPFRAVYSYKLNFNGNYK